ncbi:MAG: AbrB/MazE/SpoVT family DNA-binding domain-containing protein [Lachnospiraceae bacterium]|nr:AbrB/MazE/SpoVT family DNA-binding domain-containing protein [Lachnospiraceae bacterium]
MKPFYRIVGRRGNSTIPYALRVELGIHPDDLVSYTCDGDHIIIRKERVCDGCNERPDKGDYLDTTEMKELISSLPYEAKRDILFYLYSTLLDKPRVPSNA